MFVWKIPPRRMVNKDCCHNEMDIRRSGKMKKQTSLKITV